MMWVERFAKGDFVVMHNGVPIYKRWPYGASVLIDAYGPPINLPKEAERQEAERG